MEGGGDKEQRAAPAGSQERAQSPHYSHVQDSAAGEVGGADGK